RRMPKPNRRDRRSRGSRLVRLFRPQNCGAVGHALAGTGRVEDDPKLSRFYNGFYFQGDRSTTYAKRATDCKGAGQRAHRRHERSVGDDGGDTAVAAARPSGSPEIPRATPTKIATRSGTVARPNVLFDQFPWSRSAARHRGP